MKHLLLLTLTFALFGCSSTAEKARDNLRVGMNKDQVMDILGIPSYMSKGNTPPFWWTYYESYPDPSVSVWFDKQGKVTKWATGIPTGGSSSSSETNAQLEQIDGTLRHNQIMNMNKR